MRGKPVLCFYYITYRCNAKCVFCGIPKRGGPLAETGRVFAHLDQLAGLGVRYIDFTGGEPLLHPDLNLMLEKSEELGLHTTVTTNCMLYPSRAKELRGLVDFLHFSLDSADKSEHDGIRGIPCFDKVMESIETARDLGERPDILMTVTRDNLNRIEPMLEIAAANKLMLVLNPVFDYSGDGAPDRSLAKKMLEIPPRKYLYNNTAFLKMILEGGNNPVSPRCRAVSAAVVISPEGKMLLPCFHRAVESLEIEEGIEAARNSSAFRKALHKQGRYDFCRGCTINCYFDPSFLYTPDALFIRSLAAKVKYAYDKFLTG